MRRLNLITLFLLCANTAFSNPAHTIKLANGLNCKVEACADGIFRISLTEDAQFAEPLLNRYGVVKTDWASVQEPVNDNSGTFCVSTRNGSVCIDKNSGSICLKDAKGGEDNE